MWRIKGSMFDAKNQKRLQNTEKINAKEMQDSPNIRRPKVPFRPAVPTDKDQAERKLQYKNPHQNLV